MHRGNLLRHARRRALGARGVSLAMLLPLAGVGCGPEWQLGPGAAGSAQEVVAARDRDLASGRFEVLADFESPGQATLFRLDPPAEGSIQIAAPTAAPPQMGAGSLHVTLAGPSQQLVARDTPAGEWALRRDWSGYQLLLVTVFTAQPLEGFHLSVQSGVDQPFVYVLGPRTLEPGWNLIRVDLGSVGERIDLGNVRELRCWCEEAEGAVDFELDDLLLADNARDLFGSSAGEPGELYVRLQGRRLAVGSVGRFELVFYRGRIRQWFDLSSDAGRHHDLVGEGCLGPVPVRVSGEGLAPLDGASAWSELGPRVVTHQRLVEADPLRAVLEGTWQFGAAGEKPGETSPSHQWRYSIYRDGRVYVSADGSVTGGSGPGDAVVMAFGCEGTLSLAEYPSAGGDAEAASSNASSGTEESDYAWLTQRDGKSRRADLLIVPASSGPMRMLSGPDKLRRRVGWEVPVREGRFAFAAMVRVWPHGLDAEQVELMAADYHRPQPLHIEVGELALTEPGDADGDGFDESSGCYALRLSGRRARLRVDGNERVRFSPVFRLVGVADRDAWVYADGMQIRDACRDADGNLLFVVPGVITGEVLIEITSSRPETPIEW